MTKENFPPPRFRDTKCKLCDSCHLDTLTNRCVYGGPFKFVEDKDSIASFERK